MVKFFNMIGFCILLSHLVAFESAILYAQEDPREVVVSAEIDAYRAIEGHLLRGTISITHNSNAKIDESSFKVENDPLKVELLKTVSFSPSDPVQMSIYQFTLPTKTPGLYILPEISVQVGGVTYKSIPSSFTVIGAAQAAAAAPSETTDNNQNSAPASLALKASLDGPNPIYPGQRVWLTYRFYFSGNIALEKEVLPLLDPAGLEKIGDKRIREYDENGLSVREVIQEAKVTSPGIFTFPPSFVEGYAFRENALKQRIYLQPKLRSETEAITLTVVPFPKENKPAIFDGAVGPFIFEASLLTPAKVAVDDKMQLSLTFSGDGDLQTVTMPDLAQAGFKRQFHLSDLPPKESVQNNIKQYIIELAPLSTSIQEIPPIPFSYFDPLANHYEIIYSQPIPITVTETSSPATPPAHIPVEAQKTPPSLPATPPAPIKPMSPPTPQKEQTYFPAPVEIKGNIPLTPSDLTNKPFGTWRSLWVIPIGLAIIALQLFLKRYLKLKREYAPKIKTTDLFEEAMQLDSKDSLFFQKLTKVFLLRLAENGWIKSAEITPEELSSEGLPGKIRSFLNSIEEKRFTRKNLPIEELRQQARALFSQISQKQGPVA